MIQDIVRYAGLFAAVVGIGLSPILWATIRALKANNEALTARVMQLAARVEELERRNAELTGRLQEREDFIRNMMDAVLKSGACAKAWECVDRVLPNGYSAKRAKKGGRKNG